MSPHGKPLRSNAESNCELDNSQGAQKSLSTEAEKNTTLEAFTRQPVKTQQTAVVKCRVCESATAPYLPVVTSFKSPTNPITNPNPVYDHSTT
jgi:hypothetical protein